ncbi:MAG: hypothetical protein EOP49_50220 [Sphingobacteriales bacterium]|nr:MAG: hypothetical protein EOP49_50220 [Sphingobacteriales bacterium]
MDNLLIVADLSEPDPVMFSYGTGLEDWVRSELPEVQLLDLDAGSDKSFALQIKQGLQKAKKAALWIKSDKSGNGLGGVAGLVEFAVRNPEKCLLLLEGENAMLERFGKATKGNFVAGAEEELKLEVIEYFEFAG